MIFRKQDTSADEFWKKREAELGMPVVFKGLCRAVSEDHSELSVWGLIYTTAAAVYFQTFQSENWLSLLFSGGKKKKGQDEIIEIPVETIEVFRIKPVKKALFFRKPPVAELRWNPPQSGETRYMLFEMDRGAEDLISSVKMV